MRAACLLALLAAPWAAPASADTFVLVHGAWAGEWAWDGVAPLLEAEGHEVVAVALKGTGSRAAEGGPGVSVEDNVADVEAAILAAAEPVILVGHSWGTRPAAGAWDRQRDRVAAVVWVEGTAPVVDPPPGAPLLRADAPTLAFLVGTQPDVVASGMLPPPPTARDAAGRAFAPMSLRQLYGAVPATGEPLAATPCTYVLAEESELPILRRYGEALRDRRGCELIEVEGGHDVPAEQPEALAAILLDVAAPH